MGSAAGQVIAIDGPAGSGKSTVAARVAHSLGWAHLDTGAMYRAVTWAVLRAGLDAADGDAVAALARALPIEVGPPVIVDGQDVTGAIRGPEVSGAVSVVAAHPGVRQDLVRRQRVWVADHGGGVVEGRDIGSVVFPRAELKVYLTASDAERAMRRAGQDVGMGRHAAAADIARRDLLDSARAASPLQVADGAVVIDTTGRPVDDVVEEVLAHL
ncbi:MAG TPA: (d)CMP kinase [Acidimicrobiales bacterium]